MPVKFWFLNLMLRLILSMCRNIQIQEVDWQPCLKVRVTFQLFQAFKNTIYSILKVKSVLLAINLGLKERCSQWWYQNSSKCLFRSFYIFIKFKFLPLFSQVERLRIVMVVHFLLKHMVDTEDMFVSKYLPKLASYARGMKFETQI